MSNTYAESVFPILRKANVAIYQRRHNIRVKPMLGGRWGSGKYQMASLLQVGESEYSVHFLVQEVDTRWVVAFAETKAEALGLARKLLDSATPEQLASERTAHLIACAEIEAQERKYWEDIAARNQEERSGDKVKSIPRRRRLIFEESGGKCHYCETVLTLDGKWHIEHKMPKALGGGNEPGNLVASCVACNMKKRDTTDVEFKARMNKEAAQ